MFSGLTSSTSGSLFSLTGPSIFDFKSSVPPASTTPTTTNIFGGLSNHLKDKFDKDKDGEESDGSGGYKDEEPDIDPEKVINDYVYDNPYDKIIDVVFRLFRNHSSSTKRTPSKPSKAPQSPSNSTSKTRRFTFSSETK